MPKQKGSVALPLETEEIIKDYRLAYQSRQANLIGRREVLSGKAKFEIFGDGKELAEHSRFDTHSAKVTGAPVIIGIKPGCSC